MNFPYYKQEMNYTCGSVAMRMALEKCGIEKSEKQVVNLLKTNKVRGTWHKDFPRLAEKYKLDYVVKRNSSLKEMNSFHKKDYTVIICFYYPPEKVDHYTILKKIDSEYIYFYDPWFGKDHRYKISYFNKIWKSDPKYDNERRWFFAMKKV